MSASATSGYQFASGELVTNTKLRALVEEATVSGFTSANMAAGAELVSISLTAPTDTTQPWYDKTLGLLRIHNGTDWVPQGRGLILTNGSGIQVVKGDLVVLATSADNTFTTTTTPANARVIGIAAETIANGASGVIITRGRWVVNLASSSTRGNFFATTSVATKGDHSSVAATGECGILLSSGLTNLCPCLLWGQPAL